jgi:hypothetical protein
MNKKGCEGCSSAIFFVIFCILTILAFQAGSTPPGPVTCAGQVMKPADRCLHLSKKDRHTNTYEQEKAEQESLHNNTRMVFVIPAVLAALCLVYMVYRFIPSKKKQQQQAQLTGTAFPRNGPPPNPYSAPRPGAPPPPYYQQNPPYPPPPSRPPGQPYPPPPRNNYPPSPRR